MKITIIHILVGDMNGGKSKYGGPQLTTYLSDHLKLERLSIKRVNCRAYGALVFRIALQENVSSRATSNLKAFFIDG
jgi:hypothetical protein